MNANDHFSQGRRHFSRGVLVLAGVRAVDSARRGLVMVLAIDGTEERMIGNSRPGCPTAERMEIYDTIGKTYRKTRRADERIAARLMELLSLPLDSVVADIGAGTGNYSIELARAGYRCFAIEPSMEMAKQAEEHQAIQWISGRAESIPLPDRSVAACISILSYHHFQVRRMALSEMLRIAGAGPLVFFTFCPERLSEFWLYRYFPTMLSDARASFESAEMTAREMESCTGRSATLHWFPLPFDLADWFAAAGWRRPELYLDAQVRQGISSFARVSLPELDSGLRRLSSDLADGAWEQEFGHLRGLSELDAGYVFIHLAA
jgi:ubiquinone/menaquinone biosynthesis C-methylase UbiE